MLEAKERHGDDVSRDVDLAGLEKERILGDQANIAMAMQVWDLLVAPAPTCPLGGSPMFPATVMSHWTLNKVGQ